MPSQVVCISHEVHRDNKLVELKQFVIAAAAAVA